jgi:hypothetical protein
VQVEVSGVEVVAGLVVSVVALLRIQRIIGIETVTGTGRREEETVD